MSTQQQKSKSGDKRGNRGPNKGSKPNKGGSKPNPFAKDPLQKEINEISEKRSVLNTQLTEKSNQTSELHNEMGTYKEAINQAKKYLDDNVNPKLQPIRDEEDKLRALRDKQKEDKAKFYDELNALLPVRKQKDQSFDDHVQANIRAIDSELADLDASLREIKNLKEEKRIVASIEKTRAKKQQILALKEQKQNSGNANQRLKELREKKQPLTDEVKKYQAIITENIAKKNTCYEKIQALKEEKSKIIEKLEELRQEYSKKKDLLDQKWAVYKEEQNAIQKKKKQEYEERKAQYKKEKEEREKQRKEEEAARPPMLEEIAACDAVINYLQRIRYNKKKPNQKITHSLDAFSLFSEVGMNPPQRGSQIQAAKEKINAKKEEVLAAQAVAMKKRAEEAAAKEAAEKKAAEEKAANPSEETAESAPAAEESAPAAEEPKDAPEESAPATEEPKAEEPAAPEEPTAEEPKEAPAAEEPATEGTNEEPTAAE